MPLQKPWISVAAALIEREGQYLITRRNADVHLGGLWEFPGGKCETGETFEECLRREILEELGVEITQPRLFLVHDHEYTEKSVRIQFFFCHILHGEPKPLQCAGLCWVKAEKLRKFNFPPADMLVLQLLVSGQIKEKSLPL